MATRLVITRFPFNGLAKGVTFTYDTEVDTHINALVQAGYLADITERMYPDSPLMIEVDQVGPPAQVISMPSIESSEEIGLINGPGADQSDSGGDDRSETDDSAGTQGLHRNGGTRKKVA